MLSPLPAAVDQGMLFLAARQLSGIIPFRSIAFGALNERDRQDLSWPCAEAATGRRTVPS
jgi:hypothetical protein